VAEEEIMKLEHISVDKLIPSEENPREQLEEIQELSKNIELFGQQEPLKVQRIDKDKYLIIEGHRRYAAIKLLNDKDFKVACIVEEDLNEHDRLLKSCILDATKKLWSVSERDKVWKKLWEQKDAGMLRADFARMIGVGETSVRDFIDRLNLSPDMKKLNVSAGVIKETQALEPKIRMKMLKWATKNDIGNHTMKKVVAGLRGANEKIVDAFINDDINLEVAQKLRKLPVDKIEIGIRAAVQLKKKVKKIPSILKGKAYESAEEAEKKKILTAEDFIQRLQSEILGTSGQLNAIKGILEAIEDEKLDAYFDGNMKAIISECLQELVKSIKPAYDKISKKMVEWGGEDSTKLLENRGGKRK
jgi:ParB/RepB/Spo0J family partition protein